MSDEGLSATATGTDCADAEKTEACGCAGASEPAGEPGPLDAFDGLIARVRAALPGQVRELAAAGLDNMPVAVGEHAGRGVVLKSRCAVELGGGRGSCALVLSTADASLVRDGAVTVAGPDICELPAGSEVPFAQVILVGGSELTGPCHQVLEECQSVKDWIEGYFVRHAPGELLTRVGTAPYEAGFGFAHLGGALAELVKQASPLVEAVEVAFVTSSREDVERLGALAGECREIAHALRHEAWMEKGLDIDCTGGGHCGKCSDRDVCTQVRKIERMRKRLNELDDADGGAGVACDAEGER